MSTEPDDTQEFDPPEDLEEQDDGQDDLVPDLDEPEEDLS